MSRPSLKPRNNKSSSCKRKEFDNEVNKVFTRKVRIMVNDPDATDSSEDDEKTMEMMSCEKPSKSKRFIRQVLIHSFSTSSGSRAVVSTCEAPSLPPPQAKTTRKRLPSSSPFRGVRLRKYGKWAAEIRNPVEGGRLWLGTYATAEEASQAYETAKSQFDQILGRTASAAATSNKKDQLSKNSSTYQEQFLLRKATPLSPLSVLDLQVSLDSSSFQPDEAILESLQIDDHHQKQQQQQQQEDEFNFVQDEELNQIISSIASYSSLEELGQHFDGIYCSIDDLKIGGCDDHEQDISLPDYIDYF